MLHANPQEKCREQRSDLFKANVDLTWAFDKVCSEVLWKIMEKLICHSKFIAVVRQFHYGIVVKVLEEEEEAFPATNSVKQDCVLAPTLFGMILSTMLTDAFRGLTDGIHIR